MGAIFHTPWGEPNAKIVDSIPEDPIKEWTLEEVQATIGTYSYCIAEDGTYMTVNDLYAQLAAQWKIGSSQIINTYKHNGITLVMDSNPELSRYVIMNRDLNLKSKRLMVYGMVSESNWTNSVVYIYFIPYTVTRTLSDYIALMEDYLKNGNNPENITFCEFHHSGATDMDDVEQLALHELPVAGHYIIAMRATVSTYNGGPCIYKLNLRSY